MPTRRTWNERAKCSNHADQARYFSEANMGRRHMPIDHPELGRLYIPEQRSVIDVACACFEMFNRSFLVV
jgi:hypothetical protein